METKANVSKSYNLLQIDHPNGQQPLLGYISNSHTYTFKYRDRNDNPTEITGTIFQVTDIRNGDDEICDYDIAISPIWTPEGPINERITFALTDIVWAKRVHISYQRLSNSFRRTTPNSRFARLDRFIFHFPGNDVTVTTEDFVKIAYTRPRSKLSKGESEKTQVYGYISSASSKNDTCSVLIVVSRNGEFSMKYITLDTAAITAVYPARIVIKDYTRQNTRSSATISKKAAKAAPVLKLSANDLAELAPNSEDK